MNSGSNFNSPVPSFAVWIESNLWIISWPRTRLHAPQITCFKPLTKMNLIFTQLPPSSKYFCSREFFLFFFLVCTFLWVFGTDWCNDENLYVWLRRKKRERYFGVIITLSFSLSSPNFSQTFSWICNKFIIITSFCLTSDFVTMTGLICFRIINYLPCF